MSKHNIKKDIHFVVVYKPVELDDEQQNKLDYYMGSLENCGLYLEIDFFTADHTIVFLKIHAPDNVIMKYAPLLDIDLACHSTHWRPYTTNTRKAKSDMMKSMAQLGDSIVIEDTPTSITSAERILVLHKIMRKLKFGPLISQFGLEQLLQEKVFITSFPLHDGPYKWQETAEITDRQVLAQTWANFRSWTKAQPLVIIERYFGTEYGFYFAWLGFYNHMLVPIAVLSLISLIYGFISISTTLNIGSKEICHSDVLICPRCHFLGCKYEKLRSSCTQSYLNYIFDNPATIVLAIIVSFWSTLFMELWQRREAVLQLQWNVKSVEHDTSMRYSYVKAAKDVRYSSVKDEYEPYVTRTRQYTRFTCSVSVIILLLIMMLSSVVGVTIYRIAVTFALIQHHGEGKDIIHKNVQLMASVTGSIISTCFVVIFKLCYQKLAMWLTTIETHRTQHEFDNSYVFKHYALAFTNNYSPVLYIAFFKGSFYTHPGDTDNWRVMGGLNTDRCDPSGCSVDLGIQLIFIMITKIVLNNILQLLYPIITAYITKFRTAHTNQLTESYEEEYLMPPTDQYFLVDEYMDLVVQYGFVVLFVAGFPLAPVLALINNVIEVRVDAVKLIKSFRRPIPQKVSGLGAWFGILQAITYIGVITNALVIAFTSHFVPVILYRTSQSVGFINATFSEFAVADFKLIDASPEQFAKPAEFCYYMGRRYPPNHVRKYETTSDFWYLLMLRFAVVLIFEHVMIFLKGILAYAIPDVPAEVAEQLAIQERKDRDMRLKVLGDMSRGKRRNATPSGSRR